MNRRNVIIAIVFVAVVARYAFRRATPPKARVAPESTTNTETATTETKPPSALAPTNAAAPTPAPSAPKPAEPAPPAADAAARDTLNARYLEALPERIRERASVHFFASGSRAVAAELLIDGVRVEGTDLRFLPQTPATELPVPMLPPPLNRAPTPKPFPDRDLTVEAERMIRETLGAAPNPLEIEKLEFVEKTWHPANEGLVPCLRYRVDTREKSGRAGDKENWCVDARTTKVVSRQTRVRH